MKAQHKPGEIIDKFRLVSYLGTGSFGEVWKAEHIELPGKIEAIKFALDPESLDALREEAAILQSLSHPQIVKITDMNTKGDSPYLRMEYIEGITLEDKLQMDGKLAWKDALDLCLQMIDPLEEAHKNKVFHGNLKPSNIFLCRTGIKIADFGLGNHLDLSGYNAPERKTGKLKATSDIYSLGVILYRAITGSLPTGLEPPSHFIPQCPDILDRVVSKMLSSQSKRYASLSALKQDLKSASSSGGFLFARFLFILGLSLIVFAMGFLIRIRVAMGTLVLLGLFLLEWARPRIPSFWPLVFFWLGTGLSVVWIIERMYFFIYIPAFFAVIGAIWFLMIPMENKE
ncbi:MAG: serine/threonine protein kinase [Candidatus Brocadiae bacterium]|nr:serine/threonine protein kinase [Candidatus Brocadiia bacterium]